MKRITAGGRVYGVLVANQRERLGLSQSELAVRVRTSMATIERIEDGHPPDADLRQRLSDILFPEPARNPVRRLASGHPIDRLASSHPIDRLASSHPIHRLAQGVAPRKRVSAIRVPGNRRLWGAVGTAALIALLVIAGARIFSGGDGAPSLQSSVAVSDAIGAPAAIHRARVEAQKAAVAEARREAAARRAREREQAAAAAAAAARKRAAKQAATTNGSSSTTSPPVAAPVTSSPSPSGGGGGGGSSAPAPELGHGIGSG